MDISSGEGLEWQALANCLGVDPDLFFPERGASTRDAKEVCRACIVREDCLDYALTHPEKFGIWGGLSERERRRVRRDRNRGIVEELPEVKTHVGRPARQASADTEGLESITMRVPDELIAQLDGRPAVAGSVRLEPVASEPEFSLAASEEMAKTAILSVDDTGIA